MNKTLLYLCHRIPYPPNKDIDQITHDKKLKKNLPELVAGIKQAEAFIVPAK